MKRLPVCLPVKGSMVRSTLLVNVLALIVLSAPAVAREPVSYAREVRPILAAA